MREFLDSILEFIGSESLSDEEFGISELESSEVAYSVEVYNGLKAVLGERELVSQQESRLGYYFLANGVDIDSTPITTSNIYIGDDLG